MSGGRGGFRGSRGGSSFRGRGAGSDRGFRGGRGGSSRGGFGGYDAGPPAEVLEMGKFVHAVEGEMLVESTNEKVPYFNAPIYLENKSSVGKVDEILGPINEVYFTVKMADGMVATSFTKGDKLYIGGDRLLPLERFLPKPKPAPGQKSASALSVALTPTVEKRGRGRGGSRGGDRGRGGRGFAPRGRGGSFAPRGRGGFSSRGAPRGRGAPRSRGRGY